jgi:hypothetical protein
MANSGFEGGVEDGPIHVTDNVSLPEHATDYVVIPNLERSPVASVCGPRLAHRRQAADFAKQIIEVAAHAE